MVDFIEIWNWIENNIGKFVGDLLEVDPTIGAVIGLGVAGLVLYLFLAKD